MFKITAVLAIFMVLNLSLIGQAPEHVSLSDLLDHEGAYNGKLVSIRSTVAGGYEQFGLSPDGNVVTVWVSWADEPHIVPKPEFAFLSQAERKRMSKIKSKKCNVTVATFVGRFDVAESGARIAFGHLGTYKRRLVVKSIDDVKTMKVC